MEKVFLSLEQILTKTALYLCEAFFMQYILLPETLITEKLV